MKTFDQFIVEAEDTNLGRQQSYGKNLKVALMHMLDNTIMYCEENNIDFATSKFDFNIALTNTKNINNFSDIAAGEPKEPKEAKKPEAKTEKASDTKDSTSSDKKVDIK